MKRDHRDFRVSMIVITKNRGETLHPCIRSILSQRVPFAELIVIDGSTDEKTKRYVLALRHNKTAVKYFFETSPGYAIARNRGIDIVRSPWVAFTDDDCVLDINWLGKMRQAIQKYPNAGAIIGVTKTFYPKNPFALATQFYELLWKIPAIRGDRVIDPEILDTKNVIFSARIFKRFHLRFRQEKHKEKLLSTDDIDMGMQISNKGVSAHISRNALIYHRDATRPASYFRKLLFDRYSYTQYVARWGEKRQQYQSQRTKITKSEVFRILFTQHKTPWYTKNIVRLIVSCTDKIIRLYETT